MTDKQKIKILLNFVQYVLNQWDINTKETQDKALKVLTEVSQNDNKK